MLDDDAAALKDYVYGEEIALPDAIAVEDAGKAVEKKIASRGGALGNSDAEIAGSSGYALIGEYSNESELCGGSILKRGPGEKSGGLQGFDGYYGSEVAVV